MNKREFIYEHINDLRENVMLLGDILEDSQMVDHNRHSKVLKIGFLNNLDKFGHLKEAYMEEFDVLICDDGNF